MGGVRATRRLTRARGVTHFDEDRGRDAGPDAVVAHQRLAARLAACEALKLEIERGTLIASSGARTSFSVRLNRASRARLRRTGQLDLRIEVTASAPGIHVAAATSARVTR